MQQVEFSKLEQLTDCIKNISIKQCIIMDSGISKHSFLTRRRMIDFLIMLEIFLLCLSLNQSFLDPTWSNN